MEDKLFELKDDISVQTDEKEEVLGLWKTVLLWVLGTVLYISSKPVRVRGLVLALRGSLGSAPVSPVTDLDTCCGLILVGNSVPQSCLFTSPPSLVGGGLGTEEYKCENVSVELTV